MWVKPTINGKIRYVERIKLISGKTKEISVLFDKDTKSNRKLAVELLRLKELEESSVIDSNITFFEALDIVKKKHFKNIKPNTQIQYSTSMKKIKRIGYDIPLNKVNANYILNLLDDLAVSDVNYNAHLGYIKTFLKILYRLDYIDDISFLHKLQKKRTVKEETTKYLEQEEIDQILKDLKDYPFYKNIVEFLVNTGLRFGELIALTFDDVEDNILSINKTWNITRTVNSPKSKSSNRRISLNKKCMDILDSQKLMKSNYKILYKTYDDSKNLIFPNLHGNYITPPHFRKGLKKLVSVDFKIHSLRHTHASLCIDKGIPLEYISKRLGHEDTKITQRIYIHKTNQGQQKEFDIFKDISF
ncbi:tyrosine-type recombinase/integrase [Gemella bergeri]